MLDVGTVRILAPILRVLALALFVTAPAVCRGCLEDELLRSPQAFGDPYDAYVARTGRFLPRLRRSGP